MTIITEIAEARVRLDVDVMCDQCGHVFCINAECRNQKIYCPVCTAKC